ncbi:MAG TPA: PP0621 family protein [Burkholderiaceae bacterium]
MKYLIVLVVVVLGVWLWRSNRRADADERSPPAPPPKPPPLLEIVACPVCGVHLPARDAVSGSRALYCSIDHQRQAER